MNLIKTHTSQQLDSNKLFRFITDLSFVLGLNLSCQKNYQLKKVPMIFWKFIWLSLPQPRT